MRLNNKRAAAVGIGALIVLVTVLLSAGCGARTTAHGYGVFLSATQDLSRFSDYETAVIDAQYYSKEEIEAFRQSGHKVYTYLNIGSLEDFRPYYDRFRALTLGDYENWEEEVWIDVSDPAWQQFVLTELVPALLEKGVDGFFVDNCDVYYEYPQSAIFDGLAAILRALKETGKAVVLNGGDVFLDAYCAHEGSWRDVITGINQETVFSSINWDTGTFGKADAEDHAYFTDYVERYANAGADIYLLEYTTDAALIAEIEAYCAAHGFGCYISDSIELD